ncbi:hypothetical protein [Clostridium paridis]|uniref:Uncharacterized protein n=1 Tax=Clostridium paridis TaxID=2803863 RepID=A0A937FF91_9CLOT|nr:hypothetical protein [Clostridium paridis]MBL4931825.1 hypothetical protein [Clostridium paridis]
MKKLSQEAYQEISSWVHRNARPLDLALWQYHFENGSKDAVISALKFYQNSDGGFGNAIDADNWNPNSTPYNAYIVIKMLRQINFTDITHPMYQSIFNYLENTEYKAEYGWFFTIPSNDGYPHGCWWDYNAQTNTFQSIGITASLCGFILRYGDNKSKLYEMAFSYVKMLIEKLKSTTDYGDMGVFGYCELLEDLEALDIKECFDYTYLREKVAILVREKINNEKDNFMANPLEFILSTNSRFYEENKEEVEAALDLIIDERPELGVWNIPWEWYDGGKYSKEFAISENWWKASKAIEKLLQLKNFEQFDI